jgi:hypothetical protein
VAKKNGGAQPTAPPPAEQAKQRPVYEARYGRIKVVAWANDSDKGIWYSVQVTRSYKDGKGEWHQASTFGRDDLLVVAEAVRGAWHWIARQKTNAQASDTNGGPGDRDNGSDIPF